MALATKQVKTIAWRSNTGSCTMVQFRDDQDPMVWVNTNAVFYTSARCARRDAEARIAARGAYEMALVAAREGAARWDPAPTAQAEARLRRKVRP